MQIDHRFHGLDLTLEFAVDSDMSGRKYWRLESVFLEGTDENLWPLISHNLWTELESVGADEPLEDSEYNPDDMNEESA
jgi:hypothetical protein